MARMPAAKQPSAAISTDLAAGDAQGRHAAAVRALSSSAAPWEERTRTGSAAAGPEAATWRALAGEPAGCACAYEFLPGDDLAGSFGSVRAVRLASGAETAPLCCKTVPLGKPPASGDEEPEGCLRPERALNELQVLSELGHTSPLLPTLYDCFVEPPADGPGGGASLRLVMSFTEGRELRAVVAESPCGRLPADRARFYAAEVLLALEALHAAGWLYCDLKSENVVVSDATGHATLVDFDLCARPGGANVRSGTPEYLAPEVVRGEPRGAAADVWSWGVLLYEMRAGVTPFEPTGREARSTESILHNIEHAPLPIGAGAAAPGGRRRSSAAFDFQAPEADLLTKVLERDQAKRLALQAVRAHPYFEGLDFETVTEEMPRWLLEI